jgi:hypothetical protein
MRSTLSPGELFPHESGGLIAADLDELLDLVSDPATLRRWCERAELSTVGALMDADLMAAPLHKLNRWAALQACLRALRRGAPGWVDAALRAELRERLCLPPEAEVGAQLLAALRSPPPPPSTLSPREALLLLGGVAGARAIGERMADAADPAPSIRQVRDRLRHAGEAVRKLGAGYYASAARRVDPVIDWAEERVGRQGREPLASFLKATLEAYPHGDAHAISAWLHQGPGRLIVRRGQVCYVDGALA